MPSRIERFEALLALHEGLLEAGKRRQVASLLAFAGCELPVWATGPVFIQYKGTNLCMDFTCPECDVESHLDNDFAYVIECGACHARFQMPSHVTPRLVTPEAPADFDGWEPKVTDLDED